MSELATFVDHVQDVLRDACRVPHWTPEEAEKTSGGSDSVNWHTI